MNGSSSVSMAQSARVKTEPDDWSKEDCLTLLERIRSLLPDGDAMKYKTTESHFDWEKVCFGSFTGEMCRQKWQKVSSEVRKYRTMTELIVDAIEFVKNPYKGKKLKTHPDFPKKPLTPYFRFFMEKRAKYAKIHPEMSNLDLTKILSKKYKELPDKKKQKYIMEFQREKEEFEKNMARFKEEHPELIEERKKSDLPEKPKTPQQLWYNHEKKTYMKLHPEVSQKELKEALRRQWSQLSDKRRLKWISKALELQKDYEDSMRAYLEAHPDVNSDDHVRSVLTKAERQLKDKFDGRPTKPPPNGYSLYCAELMVNMKDVPSTERMVLCSKQWKMMTQKEKDMFQKRCEQKKKQYDIDLQRFLESLPDEERDRVMTEEKMGGAKLGVGVASSPHRAKSPSVKERCREVESESWVPAGPPKERRDGKKTAAAKLPETPKTAAEMWQHSVIGDYLAKYRSDRRKAQTAMEAAWNSMEKKEKIPWIKKAAEDQKRYERELLEMRTPAAGQRKPKFDGEPKKPPVSGYQMFSQELLTNGELNHFSLKERMVEIGKRWQKLSQSQKDKYKKLVEEQQVEYKAELEAWVKSLSPQDRAVYKEVSSSKRRSTTKVRSSPGAKVRVTAKAKAGSSRAATPGVAVSKRAMAYRAKQDMSDSDEEEEKSESSDSDEDDETSGSTDSDDDESFKRQEYIVIEEFPESSEEECGDSGSDEDWMPEQKGASRVARSSSDSDEGDEAQEKNMRVRKKKVKHMRQKMRVRRKMRLRKLRIHHRPELRARKQKEKVQAADSVLVVGGGSTGVEMAAEIKTEYPDKKVVLIHSKLGLADPALLPSVRREAQQILVEKGVELVLGQKVNNLSELPLNVMKKNAEVVTDKGDTLVTDLIVCCTGLRVNSAAYSATFKESMAENGALKVNDHMQVEGFSNVYAVGDCANVNEPKMAYHAGLHAAVAVSNIANGLSGKELASYRTGNVTMLLAMGRDDGVGQYGGIRLPRFLVAWGKSRDVLVWKSWRDMKQKQP